ncbi:MAG: hypothetical protein M0Q49_04115 [Porticoccaceae bacterium]|nr:hypothetical protein [Porticoccaceae bacterium]
MSDKDFRPLDPIVPERDGLPPRAGSFTSGDDRREQAPPRSGKQPRREQAPREPREGGFPWLAAICLLALLVVAGFAWQQSRVLADLNARFNQLSARIESTDESLNQSGAALGLKLKEQEEALAEHWTEIRKLWGVSYDTNRKAIAANTEAIEGYKATINTLQANLKKAESSLAALQKSMDTASKQAAEASQSVATIRGSALSTSAQVEELQQKVTSLASTLTTTNNGVNQLRTDLSRRVADNEQALKAMDSYRAQINQQLSQLRQQIGQ